VTHQTMPQNNALTLTALCYDLEWRWSPAA